MTPSSVALISAVAPYPTDSGKKVVLAGLLDYWIERIGADAVRFVHVAPTSVGTTDLPVRAHRIPAPTAREQALSLLRRTVGRGYSIQESMLFAPRVLEELSSTLSRIDADLEIFDTVRMGQYADQMPASATTRRVIYLDDLFSVRYARTLDTMKAHPELDLEPLGDFRQVVPGPAAAIAGHAFVQRQLLSIERRLVRRSEERSVRTFPLSLLVSPVEAATAAAMPGARRVCELPPALDPLHTRRCWTEPPTFVLLGLLSLPHNHDAAMVFMRDCLAELMERVPTARVAIIGRGATPELVREAKSHGDHVTVHGYVEDLDELLSSARAVVVPLRFGSGIKIKILEALGRGVPVLTTPVGAEGIAATEQHGILVCDDVRDFPAAMERLADPAYNRELSTAAAAHHSVTYARDAAFRRYDELFGVTDVR